MSPKQEALLDAQPEALTVQPSAADMGPQSLALTIERLAANPSVDVSKLEKIIELQERILKTQAKAEFDNAFSEMQRELPVIIEHKKTDKSSYAPLEDIVQEVRPILARHGFSLSHRTEWPDKGTVKVVGILSHRQGHERESEFLSAADASGSKNPIQGLASAISYGRRYTTTDLLNIVTRGEDDDAKRAGRAPAPDGYDNWLTTLAQKADEGLPALQGMWEVANKDAALKLYAQHLTRTEPATWNSLKAKAAKIQGRKS
jgi:hypothetical protein